MSMATMVMIAGRKRDSRGRYMDGDDGAEMRNERGNNQYTRERRNDMGDHRMADMRYMGDDMRRHEDRPGTRDRPDMTDRPGMLDRPDMRREMGGEGYVIWDNHREPAWQPPERYGTPEHRGEGNITDMRQYGRRYSPGMAMGGGEKQPQKRQIGFHQGGDEQGEHLTKEQAERWVEQMRGADGSHGGRWKWNEIRQYAQNFGISGEQKMIEFFAIINAMASDYGKIAKKYGVDKVDFYADLAKAWLDDVDAVPGKAMIYYDCIVQHD